MIRGPYPAGPYDGVPGNIDCDCLLCKICKLLKKLKRRKRQ